MSAVEIYLRNNDIDFIRHDHPAVFTCEEATIHCANIPGMAAKNLFLRDEKGKRHFLVSLPAHASIDLKRFAAVANAKKVSFASADRLMDRLGLAAGSVSPFGLINDTAQAVEYFIDRRLYDAPIVNFHPNVNTASLSLERDAFHRFLEQVGTTMAVFD